MTTAVRLSTAMKRNTLGVEYTSVHRGRYVLRPPLALVGRSRNQSRPITASAPVRPGDEAWIDATPEQRAARGIPMPAGLREIAEEWSCQRALLTAKKAEVESRALPEATFDQVFESYLAASTIKDKEERRKLYRKHVKPHLGHRRIADTANARDVQAVVDAPLRAGLSETTALHVYHCMSTVFDHAYRADQVPALDFLKKVRTPEGVKKDKRKRVLLTDDEVGAFVTSARVPLYLRAMAMVCRHLGGCRASDAHAMRWEHFSPGLETVFIERPKTGDDEELFRHKVPDGVRVLLLELHLAEGRPPEGYVFGRRRARRKGAEGKGSKKGRGVGYARRLRYWLAEIGLKRYELHHDTSTTRRVDWHSFRRGFCTELAVKNVNTTRAMKLAGHRDPRTHQRYVDLSQDAQGLEDHELSPLARGVFPG